MSIEGQSSPNETPYNNKETDETRAQEEKDEEHTEQDPNTEEIQPGKERNEETEEYTLKDIDPEKELERIRNRSYSSAEERNAALTRLQRNAERDMDQLDSTMQNERTQLKEARESLGLPENAQDEKPQSIRLQHLAEQKKRSQTILDMIEEEKREAKQEGQEESEHERLKKELMDNVSEPLRKTAVLLRQREQEGLNQLFDEDVASKLRKNAGELTQLQSGDDAIETLRNIQEVSNRMEQGSNRKERRIKENEEVLKPLIISVKRTHEELDSILRNLNKNASTKTAEEAIKRTQGIRDSLVSVERRLRKRYSRLQDFKDR